jgi:opacity protein-like surface antigen
MHRASILCFVIAVVVSFAISASAADDALFGKTTWSRPGLYVGGGFGVAWDFLEDPIENVIPELDIQTGWSANARAGIRATSWFAFEALYEGQYNIKAELDGIEFANSTNHALLANFKFILPSWRLHPYIGIGLGAQYGSFRYALSPLNLSRWDFALRPSLGLDSYITRNWLVNLEVAPTIRFRDWGVIPSAATDNITLTVSAGLQYRF